MNHQRGEWLIAPVSIVLGLTEAALRHAIRCLELTNELDACNFKDVLSYMFNKNNQNFAVSEALFSQGPHPDFADKLSPFGQFIGSWDVEFTDHLPNGSTQTVKGEVHFGWALEGRAILDVWIFPRRELRAEMPNVGEYGVTVRFYDPDIEAWRSTWIGPAKRFVFPFIGRFIDGEIILEGSFGGEIVLEGSSREGILTRWIFSEITADSFKWRAVQSSDNWTTHLLYQEIVACRVTK